MKNLRYTILLICVIIVNSSMAQPAFQNNGNIRIHQNGNMGFHTDLINNGSFINNQGLAGFYSNDIRFISGTENVSFLDMESFTENGLFLERKVTVNRSANFISGLWFTPKSDSAVRLNFSGTAFYTSADDSRNAHGFVGVNGSSDFTFPVGDDNRLRSLTVSNVKASSEFICAYFFENPNSPVTLSGVFDTSKRGLFLNEISSQEFWVLKGNTETQAILSWDSLSNTDTLTDDLSQLRVVGWSIENEQWEDLGNTSISGTADNGTITSASFNPDVYAILTFGSSPIGELDIGNYFVSPNGDGDNDSFVIEGIEQYPNNSMQIFNRWGRLVYKKMNYSNQFSGVANTFVQIGKGEKLPSGVYFFILKIENINIQTQGYIYLVL